MASQSAAVRRPPASLPSLPESSAPAGGFARRGEPYGQDARRRPAAVDLNAPTDIDVAVEAARRRGRGAQSNASGRYESVARIAFDDGWQSLEELPPFQTTVISRLHAKDHHAQRFARHFVRPLDQSLSRLRARLRLLLRAARRMPISGCRRDWISSPSCSRSPKRRSCSNANCRHRVTCRAPSPSAPTPILTSRSSASIR